MGRQVRKFSGIRLLWGSLAPAGCTIQISDGPSNAFTWKDLTHASCSPNTATEIACPQGESRYVTDANSAPAGCELKEFIVEGELPPATRVAVLDLPPKDEENKISLDDVGWKLQNAMFVTNTGADISQPAFAADS